MEGIKSQTPLIAVISSGKSRGSNLDAMANAFAAQGKPVWIAFVIHTLKDAPILDICRSWNIPGYHIPYRDPMYFESRVLQMINDHNVSLIALAGFLKKLSSNFCNDAKVPVLNIHPALLPAYGGTGMYGMNVHNAVWKAGEEYSGATVHLVDEHYDHGSIVASEKVYVKDCDSPQCIAARVLRIEHQLYAKAIMKHLLDC